MFIMRPRDAVALAVAFAIDTLGVDAGVLSGIPVITSASVGNRIVLLDQDQILLADDGGLSI